MDKSRVNRIALVVDADGALVKTNLLHEKVLQFIARNPWKSWRLLLWLAQGKQALERQIDAQALFDIDATLLRAETLSKIRDAQADGRPVYLVSASEGAHVQQLAHVVGGIEGVFVAGNNETDAKRSRADKLNDELGVRNFDYIGKGPASYAVWSAANHALAVSSSSAFSSDLRRRFPNAEIIAQPGLRPASYLQALRPHQWAKNLLVFLSLVAGHHFHSQAIISTSVAFVCFCLAASSAYLINDLLDLPGDRAHPRKKLRPFAAGDLPVSHGVLISLSLLLAAIGAALTLPGRFTLILLSYVAFTLAYSLFLKRKLLIDVIVLGGLYTLRVLGGIEAAASSYSYWLLMFCLFLFLGLATAKRCSELVSTAAAGKSPPSGRGYVHSDLAVLFPLAAAAGYGAVLVVALYLSSPEVIALYKHPLRLWLLCPLLLYWISRVYVLTSRNQMHHDPVIFALTDRISWLTGLVAAAIIVTAA